MLKDIKNILFNEIKEEIEKYEASKSRIESINERIKEIEKIMGLGIYVFDNSMRLQEPQKPSLIMKRFSFWDKWIFNRKQYLSVERLNREAQEKYNKEKEEYDKKCAEYTQEIDSLIEEKNLLEAQCRDIEERGIRDKFERIKSAKTLKEIDISFEEAVKLLKDNGIQLVLDESDKVITQNQSEFDKPEDFILVHKTPYAPANDEIKSSACVGAKKKDTIIWDNEEFSYEYLIGRNTVHLSQNGEVKSHFDGNFDNRKYAVLIPVKNVKDSKRLSAFNQEDTFFNEKVDIIEGYILCPKEEVENIQKTNPYSKVIGYEGECVDGFANSFLSMLGYKQENMDKWTWKNKDDSEKCSKFAKKNNLCYKPHDESKEQVRDDFIEEFNKIIGFTESIINSRNKGKIYDVENLTRAVFNTHIKVIQESGVVRKETDGYYKGIAPWYTDLIKNAFTRREQKEMYLGDFIEEDGFKYDAESDVKTNNSQLLFHILESRFNIKIPQSTKELLLKEGNSEQSDVISEFIDTIQDEETKRFLKEMQDNGEIESVNKVKNVLFIRTIIEQAYRERTVGQEKSSGDTPDIEI